MSPQVSRREVDVDVSNTLSCSVLLASRALRSRWWTVPYKVAGIPYLSGKDPSILADHLKVSRTSPCWSKMIPNLKKMCITFTSWRDPGTDYELDNLTYLQKLEILKLKAKQDYLKKLPRIRPPAHHPTLKKLSLKGLGLAWEDMKIVASLPNLQVLKLRKFACFGEKWETSEGGFSQLTFLMIDESNPKNWMTETSHFPRLKSLVLHRCWHMWEVPRDIGEIQTLELIQVDHRNKTLMQSAKQIQEDRHSLGNDSLQIRLG